MKTALGQMGPAYTPPVIRQLITIICCATVACAFLDSFLVGYLGFSLQRFFSLSAAAVSHLFLWQPISYLFLLQAGGGLTFGLIIALFFQMYLLWMMGSHIAERYGASSFIKLFFGTGLAAAGLALPIYMMHPYTLPYAGPTAALFAVFLVWAYMHHDSTLLLFFIIPVKAKWLLAGGLGLSLLIFLSGGYPISLIMLLTGIVFGFVYAVYFKGLKSPYPFLAPVDAFFTKGPKKSKGSKIFDLKTGRPVETDEEFLDRILEKISRKGEQSLTKAEKARLDKISRRS